MVSNLIFDVEHLRKTELACGPGPSTAFYGGPPAPKHDETSLASATDRPDPGPNRLPTSSVVIMARQGQQQTCTPLKPIQNDVAPMHLFDRRGLGPIELLRTFHIGDVRGLRGSTGPHNLELLSAFQVGSVCGAIRKL